MIRNRLKKYKVGVVSGNAMDKSIVVTVERKLKHPIYGKTFKKSKRFIVHDENNDCNCGDRVKVVETRPFSKMKRWRLVQIIEKAK